jgi:hypothetical protein
MMLATATAHAGGAANKGAYGEVVTTCRKFVKTMGKTHKRYVFVDGENLMYRGETASPHNVETFTQLFDKVRAEYPGHDTCVSVVYKHARRRELDACADASKTLCVCDVDRVRCGQSDEVDDVALLVCAILQASRSRAEVIVYSNDRYKWMTSCLPRNMTIMKPQDAPAPGRIVVLGFVCVVTTLLVSLKASAHGT